MNTALNQVIPVADLVQLVESYRSPLGFFELTARSPSLLPLAVRYLQICLSEYYETLHDNIYCSIFSHSDHREYLLFTRPQRIYPFRHITLTHFLMTVVKGAHVALIRQDNGQQTRQAAQHLCERFPLFHFSHLTTCFVFLEW